jgi:hypothetical protein
MIEETGNRRAKRRKQPERYVPYHGSDKAIIEINLIWWKMQSVNYDRKRNKKPGFIIDIRYSREEVPGTAPQKYEK